MKWRKKNNKSQLVMQVEYLKILLIRQTVRAYEKIKKKKQKGEMDC